MTFLNNHNQLKISGLKLGLGLIILTLLTHAHVYANMNGNLSSTKTTLIPSVIPSAAVAQHLYPYHLPKKFKIHYETKVWGLSGESDLQFEQKTSPQGEGRYQAELTVRAKVLFKTFAMRYASIGQLNATGLHPLQISEQRVRGDAMTTTIDPQQHRAVSSQAGILPYNAQYLDILSMVLQLGINQQLDKRWQQAGMAENFTVYRPGGMTVWRLQSQGLHTILVGEQSVPAIYIKRIPLGDGSDVADDEQHLWLDPARDGLPIKMRFIDKQGHAADIVMTRWQE